MTTIWDHATAVAARDEGMLRVQAHSAPWAAVAMDALCAVAADQDILSSEDVWRYLDAIHMPRPEEARAMGPVMQRAIRAGLISPAGWTTSTDPKSHADPMRLYRSAVR